MFINAIISDISARKSLVTIFIYWTKEFHSTLNITIQGHQLPTISLKSAITTSNPNRVLDKPSPPTAKGGDCLSSFSYSPGVSEQHIGIGLIRLAKPTFRLPKPGEPRICPKCIFLFVHKTSTAYTIRNLEFIDKIT